MKSQSSSLLHFLHFFSISVSFPASALPNTTITITATDTGERLFIDKKRTESKQLNFPRHHRNSQINNHINEFDITSSPKILRQYVQGSSIFHSHLEFSIIFSQQSVRKEKGIIFLKHNQWMLQLYIMGPYMKKVCFFSH